MRLAASSTGGMTLLILDDNKRFRPLITAVVAGDDVSKKNLLDIRPMLEVPQ